MAKLIVTLSAAVFVLYGIGFTLSPEAMSVFVTGGAPTTPSGLIDLRSTYGGLSIAVGALLLLLARKPEFLPLGVRGVAFIMAAMATTRTIGILTDGPPNSIMWAFLAAEVAALSIAIWQIRAESRA